MKVDPEPGEIYFVDLGIAQKPRSILIFSARHETAPLAVVTGLSLTTRYHGTPFEVVLPKLAWMREQSYVNTQSLAPYKFIELQRLQGTVDASVMQQIKKAVRLWLGV